MKSDLSDVVERGSGHAALIPHNRPWITEADRSAVDSVLASGWIAAGPRVAALEEFFVQQYRGGAACAVSSGTAALFIALHSLGVKSGDEVAVPSYSCPALLNAVHMAGAKPSVVDILPDAPVIDASGVADTGAGVVIAVHTFGCPAALEFGDRQTIEDSCHSLVLNPASPARASVFSFYASKPVTGGQGGLIWSSSSEVAGRARDYREYDMRDVYAPRFNLQMTDIQAALIVSQLARIDQFHSRRAAIADRYNAVLPKALERYGAGPGNHRYVVRTPDARTVKQLRDDMNKSGINCIVPIEDFELLHRCLGLPDDRFQNSIQAVETTLSLPIFPAMSEQDIERVEAALHSFALHS